MVLNEAPLVVPSDQELTLKFKDGNIIISMKLTFNKGQNVQEVLNNLGASAVPLHLHKSVLSCISIIFEEEKQLEREKLIQELLNHPGTNLNFIQFLVDKTKLSATNNFAEIFSTVFFSDLESQQRLMRV
jgi:RNA recognition motif-containing protein